MRNYIRILLWRLLAIVSVLLGIAGIPLPGLPTVPFMLLAAWAAGKGWPALEQKLLAHPRYGPAILSWRQYGIVSRRAKWLASIMMLGSMVLLQFSGAPLLLKVILPLFLLCVAGWLWCRPEQKPQEVNPGE
ncbi:YbaN family protein [Chromatiaceae bacterium AAb-1]|nr:YbaN family protein [Chromatiaceae bacterium AAb-1]